MEEGRCSGDVRSQGSDSGHGPCRGRAGGAATPEPGEGTLQPGDPELGGGAPIPLGLTDCTACCQHRAQPVALFRCLTIGESSSRVQ